MNEFRRKLEWPTARETAEQDANGPESLAEAVAAIDARMKARIAEVAAALPGAPHAVVREVCRADPELQALGRLMVDLTDGPVPRGPGEAVH